MSSSRIRLTASTLQGKSSPLVLSSSISYSDLLSTCSAKLKIKAKRIWLVSGLELNADNLSANMSDGVKIIVSKGENYQPANKSAESSGASSAEPAAAAEEKEPSGAASVASPSQPAVIRVISRHSDVTPGAVAQLSSVGRTFPGVRYAIGMPDLHEGQSLPIGSAVATAGLIYPELIGTDIGCGMSLIATGLKSHKAGEKRVQRWVKRLNGIDEPWKGSAAEYLSRPMQWPPGLEVDPVPVPCPQLAAEGVDIDSHLDNVGTVGGGNHFAELQIIESVEDEEEFDRLGLSKSHLYLLVHSGSRSLGESILRQHQQREPVAPHRALPIDSPQFAAYMECHRLACAYARRNRALIAKRFLASLGAADSEEKIESNKVKPNQNTKKQGKNNRQQEDQEESKSDEEEAENEEEQEEEEEEEGEEEDDDVQTADAGFAGGSSAESYRCVLDIWHNNVCQREFSVPAADGSPAASESLWLHRKGAAPADCGPIVIPGSRGDFSYLVLPTGNLQHSAFSLAHGAGRCWSRSKARAHLAQRHPNPAKLKYTDLRSHVICEDRDLLYEEAPQAYKPVDGIIADLQEEGLLKVIAVLRPLITYKTRKAAHSD